MGLATAHAHESRPAYLELQQKAEDTYSMLWKVPAKGPETRLGLYVRLPDDCNIVEPARSLFVSGAFVERSTIRRSGGLEGAEISIEGLSTTLTDTWVRIGRTDGSTQVVRLTPSAPSFVVEATPTATGVAKTYLLLGIQHIWNGVDHLLFVACLIPIAGTWRRILVTVTDFTIAHSITLALAALNVVRVPIAPVEACIAVDRVSRDRARSRETRYAYLAVSHCGLRLVRPVTRVRLCLRARRDRPAADGNPGSPSLFQPGCRAGADPFRARSACGIPGGPKGQSSRSTRFPNFSFSKTPTPRRLPHRIRGIVLDAEAALRLACARGIVADVRGSAV